MSDKLFKFLLIALAIVNLTCALTLAWLLFQQVSDENIFENYEPGKIIVTRVTTGGASDRAGLKVGDIILQINHRTFANAAKADAIMRANEAGSVLQYDILRDGKPMIIYVRLARIQIRLFYISLSIGGLMLLMLGLFVGLKRPQLFEARIFALSSVLIFIIFFMIGNFRSPSKILLAFLFSYSFLSCFAGFAATSHAGMYFPVRKFEHKKTYRIAKYYYGAAGLTMIMGTIFSMLLPSKNYIVLGIYFLLISPLAIYSWIKTLRSYKVAKRSLKYVKMFVFASCFAGVLALNQIPIRYSWGELFFLSIIAIPVSHLYLIQKNHIFDIYIVIKRTGIYRSINTVLIILSVLFYIALVNVLAAWDINLPTVYFHGGSIEFLWSNKIPAAAKQLVQKAALIGIGIGLAFLIRAWFGLFKLWLDKKFYREKYDYKTALSEFTSIMPEELDIKVFFENFITRLNEIMRLKGASLVYDNRVVATRGINLDSQLDFKQLHFDSAVPFPVNHYEDSEIRTVLAKAGVEFIVPILAPENETAAILFCGGKLSESDYNQEDVEFLQAVANYIFITLAHLKMQIELQEKHRIQDELNLARKIQRDSLPASDPELPRLDVSSFMQPAKEVGGDYFDYFTLSQSEFGIIIGDVSGKGIPAALHVAKIQGIIRSSFPIYREPKALFENLNELLYLDFPKTSFFTAIGSIFDMRKNKLKWVRAGHEPIVYYDSAKKEARLIVSDGLGLGLVSKVKFNRKMQPSTIHYRPNDIFLFYTDGLSETMNDQHELYGDEKVLGLIEENHDKSAAQIQRLIIRDLMQFKGTHQQHDDLTLVVVKARNGN